MVRRISLLAVGVGALALCSFAMAQDQGGRQGNDRGGRGNFDPAQFRERMMNRMKEEMGSTDDEWKVLAPKIEKVMTAQRETRAGGFGGRGGPGGGPGGDRGGDRGNNATDQPVSKVAQAQRDLRTTLENKSAAADEISKKLDAFRKARDAAKADLQAAQKALKEVVTQRQEAMLVMSGMLE